MVILYFNMLSIFIDVAGIFVYIKVRIFDMLKPIFVCRVETIESFKHLNININQT